MEPSADVPIGDLVLEGVSCHIVTRAGANAGLMGAKRPTIHLGPEPPRAFLEGFLQMMVGDLLLLYEGTAQPDDRGPVADHHRDCKCYRSFSGLGHHSPTFVCGVGCTGGQQSCGDKLMSSSEPYVQFGQSPGER